MTSPLLEVDSQAALGRSISSPDGLKSRSNSFAENYLQFANKLAFVLVLLTVPSLTGSSVLDRFTG